MSGQEEWPGPGVRTRALSLARDRQYLADLRAELATKQAEFEQENADLLNGVKWWAERVAEHERTIRDTGANELEAEPVPGFTVYTETVLEYEPEHAILWAVDHRFTGLLKLDVRAFEATAKQLGLQFVKFSERRRVRIARDLSALLSGEEQREASE